MADNKTKEQRSKNMASIKSKNTKPEVFVRKLLFNEGYRFRKNINTLPGHPDIWLRKYNTVIFINGCFWHNHRNCKRANLPKSNSEYWTGKIERNKRRDRAIRKELKNKKIKCLLIWECSINKIKTDEEKNLF